MHCTRLQKFCCTEIAQLQTAVNARTCTIPLLPGQASALQTNYAAETILTGSVPCFAYIGTNTVSSCGRQCCLMMTPVTLLLILLQGDSLTGRCACARNVRSMQGSAAGHSRFCSYLTTLRLAQRRLRRLTLYRTLHMVHSEALQWCRTHRRGVHLLLITLIRVSCTKRRHSDRTLRQCNSKPRPAIIARTF